jgi:hypothetical protein
MDYGREGSIGIIGRLNLLPGGVGAADTTTSQSSLGATSLAHAPVTAYVVRLP